MPKPSDPNQASLFSADDYIVREALSRPGEWQTMQSSRVLQARYDRGLSQIHVIFKDGTPWVYDNVPENIWRNFRRTTSPGKYINRVLNAFPYWRGGFDFASYQDQAGEQ